MKVSNVITSLVFFNVNNNISKSKWKNLKLTITQMKKIITK